MSPGRVTAADKEPFSARVQGQGDGQFRGGEREYEVEGQRCCDAVPSVCRVSSLSLGGLRLGERSAHLRSNCESETRPDTRGSYASA